MGKGIAIPYVIALILGVAIIGLIGFWFASSGGKFSGQSSKTVCENKFLSFCSKRLATGAIDPATDKSTFTGAGESPECSGLFSYDNCNGILGTSGTGSPPPVDSEEVSLGDSCDAGRACISGLICCTTATCTLEDFSGTCRKPINSPCSFNSDCYDNSCTGIPTIC